MWSSSVVRSLALHRRLLLLRSFAADAADGATAPSAASALYLKQLHEPQYLQLLKPGTPFYESLNVRVRGFDFPILESYVRWLQQVCASDLRLTTSAFWGVPAVSLRLDAYQSSVTSGGGGHRLDVSCSDHVRLHERTLQLRYVTTVAAGALAEAAMCGKPAGVTVRLSVHDVALDDDVRFIPDLQLEAMQQELELLRKEPISVLSGGPVAAAAASKKKKKK